MTKTPLEQVTVQYHAICMDALKDISEVELNWHPPGDMNPISATLLHLISSEDFFLNALAQGKPALWYSDSWNQRLDVKLVPTEDYQGWWNEIKQKPFSLSVELEYMQAVQASTTAFVQGLTEAELSRTVSVFGHEQQVIDLIATVITHGSSHAGEITTLRALMNALSS